MTTAGSTRRTPAELSRLHGPACSTTGSTRLSRRGRTTASSPIRSTLRRPPADRHRGGVDVCFGGIGINGHSRSTSRRSRVRMYSQRGVRGAADARAEPGARDANDQHRDRRRRDRRRPRGVTVGMKECLAVRRAAVLLQSSLAGGGRAARAAWADHAGVPGSFSCTRTRTRHRRRLRGRDAGRRPAVTQVLPWPGFAGVGPGVRAVSYPYRFVAVGVSGGASGNECYPGNETIRKPSPPARACNPGRGEQ